MFGYPGGAIMPFYDDLYGAKDIRHVLTRHEQGAAHAAEGYARASGKPGVCISTSGPGATNLATGLADAYVDSIPIIALSGQVTTRLIGNDAFQEADIFGMTMQITKYNFKLMRAKDIPLTMKRAFYIATNGRPGPVHIDFPKDVQTGEFDFEYPKDPKLQGYKPEINPHPFQISKAVDLLVSAERPTILAGGGILLAFASKELFRFAELLGCPVTTTLMGKGAFPENHPLFMGQPGMHGRHAANYVIQNSDVLFAIGTRFDDRVTGDVKTFAPMAKVIHADIDSAEIGKNIPVEVPMVGDAKLILKAMIAELEKRAMKKEKSIWSKHFEEIREACTCDFNYKSNPIKPQAVIHHLNQLAPKKSIFVTEVGQHQMFAMHFLKCEHPNSFISSGGLGTMGFGLPAAIGAKAAKPDHTVIDISGDGSLQMNCQEIATSIEADLPVVAVVLNNNWLGMVGQWQRMFYDKRYSHVKFTKNPDLVKLAEAFGGKGIRVERISELEEALKTAFKSDVFTLVDIVTDQDEDILPMVPSWGNNSKMVPSKACLSVAKKWQDNIHVPADRVRAVD